MRSGILLLAGCWGCVIKALPGWTLYTSQGLNKQDRIGSLLCSYDSGMKRISMQ